MKRGSSLRFIEWPMPQTFSLVRGVELMTLVLSRLARLGGRVLDRLDDVDVAGAAAEVSGDRPADLVLVGVLVALDERARSHHHARGAEAALEAVLLHEALLDGVQLVGLQALHGAH